MSKSSAQAHSYSSTNSNANKNTRSKSKKNKTIEISATKTFSFFARDAKLYGTDAATILYHIKYWVERNKEANKNFHDDQYWTYGTIRVFRETFPHLTESQIKTAIKKLEERGAIKSGNYNKQKYDRTKWFSVIEQKEKKKKVGKKERQQAAKAKKKAKKNGKKHDTTSRQKSQMDWPKLANGLARNGQPIPDIKTNISTNNNQQSTKAYAQILYDKVLSVGRYGVLREVLDDTQYTIIQNYPSIKAKILDGNPAYKGIVLREIAALMAESVFG